MNRNAAMEPEASSPTGKDQLGKDAHQQKKKTSKKLLKKVEVDAFGWLETKNLSLISIFSGCLSSIQLECNSNNQSLNNPRSPVKAEFPDNLKYSKILTSWVLSLHTYLLIPGFFFKRKKPLDLLDSFLNSGDTKGKPGRLLDSPILKPEKGSYFQKAFLYHGSSKHLLPH